MHLILKQLHLLQTIKNNSVSRQVAMAQSIFKIGHNKYVHATKNTVISYFQKIVISLSIV